MMASFKRLVAGAHARGRALKGWPHWQAVSVGFSVGALAFLSFVAGAASIYFKFFPYQPLTDAFKGGVAVVVRATAPPDKYARAWSPARSAKTGVTRYDSARAYNGYTLFTSASGAKAYLMTMEGAIVHEWGVPFSAVWDQSAEVEKPVRDDFIRWRKAYLYPNGDLLAVYIGQGTPWGYGLVKIDKDSKVLWKYLGRTHHDVDVGPDGRVYTLTHRIVNEERPELSAFELPVIEDFAVILSPEGKELKRISLLKAFATSNYRRMLHLALPQEPNSGDLLHANAIDVADAATAELFPFVRAGQLLVSFREIDTIAVVNPVSGKVVWALRGPWHRQHDPDFLSNGRMLIFDNRGNYGAPQISRILEFDPVTLEIVWQYQGNKQDRFNSGAASSQQRLANGNTLITETYSGRLFEVTPDGTIVWEYFSPFRSADGRLIAAIYWGQRFAPEELSFPFNRAGQKTAE